MTRPALRSGLGLAALLLSLACLPLPSRAEAPDPGADAGGQHPPGLTAHLARTRPNPGNPHGNGLFQASLDLQPGADYVLTFWARASKATQLSVATKNDQPPWAFFGARTTVALDTAWRKYQVAFKADGALPQHTRLAFAYMDADAADAWIADVALRKAGDEAKPETNLLANGQFENGLSQWVVDGKQPGVYDAAYQLIAPDGTPVQETASAPAP